MEVKTIDELIENLNEKHKIRFNGQNDKINLINNGYFHGYKGYRFIKNEDNKIYFNDFDGYIDLIKFDQDLKSLLYPYVMKFESYTKNRVLQLVIEIYNTEFFDGIYKKGLINYKSYYKDFSKYKNMKQKRESLKRKINKELKSKSNSLILKSFSDNNVPIWAVFEVIPLGIFADFVNNLEMDTRIRITKEMGFNTSFDSLGEFPSKILYGIKTLRNAIAHDSVVFDVRFRDSFINKNVSDYLNYELGCKGVNFESITDYLILIVFVLKNYDSSIDDLKKLISNYEQLVDDLLEKIPYSIFSKIIYSDSRNKIKCVKSFLEK